MRLQITIILHKLLQSFHNGVFNRVHESSVKKEIMKVLKRGREIYFMNFCSIAQSQEDRRTVKTRQESYSENEYGVYLSGKNMPA
jgi:hypothetical protein